MRRRRRLSTNPKPRDEGWGKYKQPVGNVSWDDTNEYVQWLSRTTGKTYPLLTEAEWEYAARASSTSSFPEGGAITAEQANFQTNFDADGSNREGRYREQPVAVGSFAPNAFGLHDMKGNVSEWVQDSWHENYAGAPKDRLGPAATHRFGSYAAAPGIVSQPTCALPAVAPINPIIAALRSDSVLRDRWRA